MKDLENRVDDSERASGALSSTTKDALRRTAALMNFYAAERRAGACPIEATERMHEYAKRLDELPSPHQSAAE